QRTGAAFPLFEAVAAFLVSVSAGAWDQRQRAAHYPNKVPIGDVDRRDCQPVASVLTAHRGDDAEAAQFRKDRRQEVGRNSLLLGDLAQANGPFAVLVG